MQRWRRDCSAAGGPYARRVSENDRAESTLGDFRPSLLLALAALALTGCAPDVMQATQQAQRKQVSKLTAGLGTPEQVRAGARGASLVLAVIADVLMKPAADPSAPAPDPEAVQKAEEKLLGEQRRLTAVAASRSDDECTDSIAQLCTPDAMDDAQFTAEISTAMAVSAPSDTARAEPTTLHNFEQAQRAVKAQRS